MTGPETLGRVLLTIGGIIVLAGLLLLALGRLGLGRLPGDIFIQRENFVFYFPLATCILISAILTLVFYLYRRFF
ncbi:MAG TPA: DUF2905 domain-containing protein [Bacillota bacterium]|nr:DUF2905 domain-containing protein [Bacillota bacterium]HOP68720.1 DUF2905 domain-containing protein [Bacillota bacterium]HPT33751.1 DUF2905 domain-containing protein [Bacillota bacterium]HPZ65423.1 DUF2905 domain-containing protein [Bacillota bacterium]HQD06725.1 DUF2905 domain-containing protein [Bacillota bacterium]